MKLCNEDHKEIYDKGYRDAEAKIAPGYLASLLCTVNPDFVMTLGANGDMFLNGVKVDDAEAASLKAEAKALENFKLWQIFQETLYDKAIKVMCINSTTFEDMRGGKLMLHNLEVIKKIVDTASRFGEK